jgi:hypothetical protein
MRSPGRGRAQIGALLHDFAGIQQIPITVQNGGYARRPKADSCAAGNGGRPLVCMFMRWPLDQERTLMPRTGSTYGSVLHLSG